MADEKISELDPATQLQSSNIIPIVQGLPDSPKTNEVALSFIKSYVLSESVSVVDYTGDSGDYTSISSAISAGERFIEVINDGTETTQSTLTKDVVIKLKSGITITYSVNSPYQMASDANTSHSLTIFSDSFFSIDYVPTAENNCFAISQATIKGISKLKLVNGNFNNTADFNNTSLFEDGVLITEDFGITVGDADNIGATYSYAGSYAYNCSFYSVLGGSKNVADLKVGKMINCSAFNISTSTATMISSSAGTLIDTLYVSGSTAINMLCRGTVKNILQKNIQDPTTVGITCNDNTQGATFDQSGDATQGSNQITNLSDTSVMQAGMDVSGTAFGGSVSIVSIDDATTITVDAEAEATLNEAFTFTEAPEDSSPSFDTIQLGSGGFSTSEVSAGYVNNILTTGAITIDADDWVINNARYASITTTGSRTAISKAVVNEITINADAERTRITNSLVFGTYIDSETDEEIVLYTDNGTETIRAGNDPSIGNDYGGGTSPAGGTLTANWAGIWASNQPGDMVYQSLGQQVTLSLPSVEATANGSSFITVVEQLPPELQPAATFSAPIRVLDNGSYSFGMIEITPAGDITIFANASSGAFTGGAGANSGFSAISITYLSA